MVVESILNPQKVGKRSPIEMIILGFIVASLAILISLWVFPSYASFAMVTFTVMAMLPFMVKIIKFEKEKQDKSKKRLGIIAHKSVIISLMFLFLGFLLAYTIWFLLLPPNIANNLFSIQINTITEMNSQVSGSLITNTPFGKILLNNLRVLALSIVFSFIFASGAIFILTWNASVLGVGVANAIQFGVAGGGNGSVYFSAISFATLRYLLHGIPEIASYFIGGLAGGIISFAILDYKFGFKKFFEKFSRPLKDAVMLIVFAIVLLIVAALIEISIIRIFT